MSLNAPLQVLIGERAITSELLDDVQYGNAAPGGFTSAQLQLARSIALPNVQLQPYQPVTIVDTRSGEVVWLGRLEDPGRSSESKWALQAVGGSAHAKDVTRPVVYNDSRNGVWVRKEQQVMSGGQASAQSDNDVDSPLVLSMPKGTVVPASGRVVMTYDLLTGSGQHVAAGYMRHNEGLATSGIETQFVGRYGPATDTNLGGAAWATAQTALTVRLGTDFTTLHSALETRIILVGGTFTVPDDRYWSQIRGLRVHGTRMNRLGAELTTGYGTSSLIAVHAIVEDVLGRYLPDYDRTNASVDTSSSVLVSQLAYEDGATAAQILDDLMVLAPTHYWAAWGERKPGAGALFEWSPWPSEIALAELDTRRDDFDSPSSAAELYNEVSVRYKDANDVTRTVVRTGDVPILTAAGLTRRGSLDLGGTMGDAAQAASAGDAFLAAHQYPSNSGTIKVSRPVVDLSTGRQLHPWQLRAGVLCKVANLDPRPDALNPTPNGETVFRVSAVSYSAKSNEATLTLDSYERTVARTLAKLARATARVRRV